MARKYVAFDIETAADIPGPEFNWHFHRPLGICCAAAIPCDSSDPILWHGKNPDGTPAGRMSREEARHMVEHLRQLTDRGYILLTWNGLGFDLNVLAEESDALEQCRDLALNQVDMMFHIFCDRGFPVALDKAAQAIGIPGKPDGMSGALAPQLWAKGRFQEVLDYVAQDVRIALQVAQMCEERQNFEWVTRKGTKGHMVLHRGWLTVREALDLPEPDTSWMSNPLPRQNFTDWLAK